MIFAMFNTLDFWEIIIFSGLYSTSTNQAARQAAQTATHCSWERKS